MATDNYKLRMWMMLICLLAAFVIYQFDSPKIFPGGPFLSISRDLLPTALCLVTLWIGVVSIRRAPGDYKYYICILLLAATVQLAFLLERIIVFWFSPRARGSLFGI